MKTSLAMLALILCAATCWAADQPRVFVTDSQSWEMQGGFGGSSAGFGGAVHGGARPQTAEIIKTFGEKCPNVMINMKQEKADYVVVLEHEGGKGVLRKDNKFAVFNWDGDRIASKSTRSLGGSVEEACKAITAHWSAHSAERAAALAAQAQPAPVAATQAPAPAPVVPAAPKITVTSNPVGADIEIDGSFVGNTPSSVDMTPGDHVIRITKSGYAPWERKMKVMTGSININAELEANAPGAGK